MGCSMLNFVLHFKDNNLHKAVNELNQITNVQIHYVGYRDQGTDKNSIWPYTDSFNETFVSTVYQL